MNLLDLDVGATDYEGEAAKRRSVLESLGVTREHDVRRQAPAPTQNGLPPQQLQQQQLEVPQQAQQQPEGLLFPQGEPPQRPMTKGHQEYMESPMTAMLKKMVMPTSMYKMMYGANEEYLADMAQYKVDSKAYEEQQAQAEAARVFQGHYANLNDGIEGPEDARARAALMGLDGVDSIEEANWVIKGGEPKVKPNYVTVDNNGEKYFMDSNNPNSPGIPMTTPEGKPIRSALNQGQVDNIGAFDRMVPRLQELNDMELAGMNIPRSTMTALRAYQQQDGNGQNIITTAAFGAWMSKYLTPEQRKYILAAEDAGMVVLRDESGAAISSDEILRQMNQYLMFSDLDDPTKSAQRSARTRKAETLMIGVPDYIKADRADQIDWVTNFDGTITSAEQIPNLTTPTDRLPAMTSAQMERYISLSKSDPDSAARLLELITLVNQEQE
jgi:hypothetical protein